MRRIPYDKLVRDYVPDIVEAGGRRPIVRIASDEEYRLRLEDKLREEVAELCEPDAARRDELADLLEVVYALAELEGMSPEDLEELRAAKASDRGRFRDRIILIEVLGA